MREYVEIEAVPGNRYRAVMIARRDALRRLGDPDSTLLADDMDRNLNSERSRNFD